MKSLFRKVCAVLLFSLSLLVISNVNASLVTFTDTDLASGNPVTNGGITLTTSNTGGSIGFIGSGNFTGLHLGGTNTPGSYSLGFSEAIVSIEIEFDALSSVGTLPVETLFNFATNSGAANISYINQFGTTFDGSTVTSAANDGQGIISLSGLFNSFSFDHDQGAQFGFVIERVVVNTSPVPVPAAVWLFGSGLIGLIGMKKQSIKVSTLSA